MYIQQLSEQDVYRRLRTGPGGLGVAEAGRRRAEYGANVIEHVQRTPAWWLLLKEFVHFFAIILWLAAALAFFAEWRAPGSGMIKLGIAIIAVIVINGGFSFWQEYRAERALAALERLLPPAVKCRRNGQLCVLSAAELVPGDVLEIAAGDRVPADARLVQAERLRVNTATLTGESLPKGCVAEPSTATHLLAANNLLLAGTEIVAGEGVAVVFATGRQTEFGQIAHLAQTADEGLSPLQQEVRRASRVIAAVSCALGAVFFLIGDIMGLELWQRLVFAVAVIVANIPEGLLPTVTLSLALATQRMAQRNALVRHLPAVEALGAATVICTDKTGTLTENRMQVATLVTANGAHPLAQGVPPVNAEIAELARVLAACHSVKLSQAGRIGDPMEIALVDLATALGASPPPPQVDEVPFDADRRRMSTVHRQGEDWLVYMKGAPEVVLALCDLELVGDTLRPLDEARRVALRAEQDRLAQTGLRLLAAASRRLTGAAPPSDWEQGLIFVGIVGMIDPPRPEVPDAIARCQRAGIKVLMVTGDHPVTALAIARQIGIVTTDCDQILTGDVIRRLTATQLQLALDGPVRVFARVPADQKMRIVQALQKKQEIVAVTGDGVNDAPALKAADIGVAMGRSGTDVAREAADMVLLDDNFATLVTAVEEGRAVFDNIRKFLTYVLTSNVAEMLPYVVSVLFHVPLPLTILQMLLIDLGTDMVPALGLGVERPAPDVMTHPPRSRRRPLLDRALYARAYLLLGPFEAAVALVGFFLVLHQAGWHYGQMQLSPDVDRIAKTTCWASIVAMQIAAVLVCRSEHHPTLRLGWPNRWIVAGILLELGLLLGVSYTDWGAAWFDGGPMPLAAWGVILLGLSLMVLLESWRLNRWGAGSPQQPQPHR